jgi:protein dispatched 1
VGCPVLFGGICGYVNRKSVVRYMLLMPYRHGRRLFCTSGSTLSSPLSRGPTLIPTPPAAATHDRPVLTLLCGVGSILAVVVGGFFLGPFTLRAENTGNEWYILGNPQVSYYDAINEAKALMDAENSSGSTTLVKQSVRSLRYSVILLYQAGDGNMFSRSNLEVMKQVEDKATGQTKYPDVCLLKDVSGQQKCSQPLSVISLIAPNASYPNSYLAGDVSTVSDATIESTLQTMAGDTYTYGFYLDTNFNSGNLKSEYTRSMILLGSPLSGYEKVSTDDDQKEKDEKAQEKIVLDEYLTPLQSEYTSWVGMKAPFLRSIYLGTAKVPGTQVQFWWFNALWVSEEFASLSSVDFLWAIFSVAGVFFYMWFHTHSILIAGVAMFMNFMSFMLGWCFYRFVCQIKFFDSIMILMIFIVLGIGADDVFVFTDAFKQSLVEGEHCESLRDRIVYTARRSSKAIFITSFTTMCAFLATATSQIMPIAAFGVFASLTIMFLYIENVLLMPATLTIYSQYFEDLPQCVATKSCLTAKARLKMEERIETKRMASTLAASMHRATSASHLPVITAPEQFQKSPISNTIVEKDTTESDNESTSTDHTFREVSSSPGKASTSGTVTASSSKEEALRTMLADEPLAKKLRWVERLFHGFWMRAIYRGRWYLLAFFAGLLALGTYYTSTLAPPIEEEEWFPKSHMLQQAITLSSTAGPYKSSSEDTTATLHMVWGVKGMDISGLERWQVKNRGNIIWDDSFNPTSMGAQTALLNACTTARAEGCSGGACSEGKLAKPVQTKVCVIEALDTFQASKYPGDATKRVGNMTATTFNTAITDFLDVTQNPTINNPDTGYPLQLGWIGGKLKYVIQTLESTYRPPKPQAQTKALIDIVDGLMTKINNASPSGANQMFATMGRPFTWFETQQALVSGAILGVTLVFALALVVLVLVTQNLIISGVSVVTIAGIVVTVMGVYARLILGWSLGIAESIAVVILIGFSMDYCLHVAAAYVESPMLTRFTRTRQSLTHMGISVLAGAATTLISSIFLFGATMTFFTKFAYLITFTIITAFSWTMFFLTTCLIMVGPEGDQGNVIAIARWCFCRSPRVISVEDGGKEKEIGGKGECVATSSNEGESERV